MDCLPRKIPVPVEGGIPGGPFTVTRSTLDPNGHLTSAMYFAIAEDSLSDGYSFNRVRMEYKKQIKPGEQVIPVRYDLPDGKTVVDLRSGDSSCDAAEFSTAVLQ